MRRKLPLFGLILIYLTAACSAGVSPLELTLTPSTLPATPTSEAQRQTPTPSPVLSPTQTPSPVQEVDTGPMVIVPNKAGEVVELARLGKGTILSAPLYSPDGNWIAIPTSFGIYLYDAITLEEFHKLPVGTAFIAFSPDSNTLAASGFGGVSLWDPATGNQIGKLQSSPEIYHWEVSFSPDGALLAAVTWESEIFVWSLASGESLFTFPGNKLQFSPDGELAVTVIYGEDQVHLYETRNGTEVKQWNTWHAGFAPGGQLWLEDHESVRLAYLDRNQVTAPFSGNQPVFSADGTLMALFAHQQISVYDHQKGRRTQMLEGNFVQINELQFSPDGQTLAGSVDMLRCPTCPETDGLEPYLILWRVVDGSIISQMEFPSDMISFSIDGSLVTAAQLESVQFIQTLDGSVIHQLEGFSAPVIGMALTPDGNALAAVYATNPYTLRFWDLKSGQVTHTLQGREDATAENNMAFAFSPDGEYLAVGGDLWNLLTGEQMTVIEQAVTAVTSCRSSAVSFSPIEESFATGCFEGQLDLWRMPDGELLKRFGVYSGWVFDLAYSPVGNYLAAVYGIPDDLVQIWQLPDGKPISTILGENFSRVACSMDGRMLATVATKQEYDLFGNPAGFVQLWKSSTGENILQLDVDDAVSIAFSPDDQILATGSLDGTLRLWEIADGTLLMEATGHYRSIQRLAFASDGTFLVSGSLDGTVMLWGIPPLQK